MVLPIVDIHVHAAGIGCGSACFVSEKMRKSWKFPVWLRAFGVSRKALEKEGDKLTIDNIGKWIKESRFVDGAVVIALDGVMDDKGELDKPATEIYVDDDFVAQNIKLHQGLYFGASINPLRKDALDRLQKAKENGAVLIKWLPAVQMFDPADSKFNAFYQKLVELNLTLLSHVGDEDSFTITNNTYSVPKRLTRALEIGVKVIAPHMASSGRSEGKENFAHLVEMMHQYPNLYADLSALTQNNRKQYLAPTLSDKMVCDKLMYGTDHPLSRTPLVTPWQYLAKVGLGKVWEIHKTENSFDSDYLLKKALGVPDAVFRRGAEFLGIK